MSNRIDNFKNCNILATRPGFACVLNGGRLYNIPCVTSRRYSYLKVKEYLKLIKKIDLNRIK